MKKLQFSANVNGKMYSKFWNDVRLAELNKFVIGDEFEVMVGNNSWGIVRVEAAGDFMFVNIRPILSYLIYGKPPSYMAAMLKKYYDAQLYGGVKNDTQFTHIVFSWVKRNIACQNAYLTEYWKDEVDAHTQRQLDVQGNLFD